MFGRVTRMASSNCCDSLVFSLALSKPFPVMDFVVLAMKQLSLCQVEELSIWVYTLSKLHGGSGRRLSPWCE